MKYWLFTRPLKSRCYIGLNDPTLHFNDPRLCFDDLIYYWLDTKFIYNMNYILIVWSRKSMHENGQIVAILLLFSLWWLRHCLYGWNSNLQYLLFICSMILRCCVRLDDWRLCLDDYWHDPKLICKLKYIFILRFFNINYLLALWNGGAMCVSMTLDYDRHDTEYIYSELYIHIIIS